MDLETWRKEQRLAYAQLADLLGEGDPNTARRHALGLSWPNPERIETIRAMTGGRVTLEAMHRRRLAAWRAQRGHGRMQAVAAE